MGEDSVKNQDQEGYRSLWELLQTLFWISLGPGALSTLDGFVDLLRVC
jgi:hypothetical protein